MLMIFADDYADDHWHLLLTLNEGQHSIVIVVLSMSKPSGECVCVFVCV